MTTRYQSQGERSNFSGSEEAPAAETASASAGKGGQEQGDPALRTYLSLIRDIPVLSRDETSLLSDAISQGEAEFRGAMNRMPAVAFRVLSLWEDRQKDGRNTGLLAHGYHGDVRHDWASDIDKALHGLVAALGDQGLGSIADVTTQAVEVSPEAISCLEQCPILLELYIDIIATSWIRWNRPKATGLGALSRRRVSATRWPVLAWRRPAPRSRSGKRCARSFLSTI